MTVCGLQDQLAEVIDMLLDRHPMGLRVLTGEAPPPTQEEVHLMYQAGRVGDDPGVRVGNPGTPPSPRMDHVLLDKQKFDQLIEDDRQIQRLRVERMLWASTATIVTVSGMEVEQA